jgi:hypothetical protein
MSADRETIDLLKDPTAINELVTRVMERLRAIARRAKGGTADPMVETDVVVNEALIKVVGGGPQDWESSDHFFGVARNAMRQVVIDYARKFRLRQVAELADEPMDLRPADDKAETDDLGRFLREQVDAYREGDPDGVRVMQLLLSGDEEGRPLEVKEVAARLKLEPAAVYRARARMKDRLAGILAEALGIERRAQQ